MKTAAMARRFALLSTAAAALLAACSGGPKADPDDYFPLDDGHAWTYRMTTTRDDDLPKSQRFTIHARAAQNMGGDPAHRRHTSDGTDYWLRSDKTGIYRIAARTPLDLAPLADEPHRYVLQKPYQPGTNWQATTTAYVLQRRSEVPKEIRRTHKPFPMTYTIASMDEKLVVPAGTFERCMRVDGRAAVRVYVDAQFAWRDIPLTTQEWYCPGVGLAKVERVEASPSRFMVGGKVAMELVEWR